MGIPRTVVALVTRGRDFVQTQEFATQRGIARAVAHLLGGEFGDVYDASRAYGAPLFFVPDDTLLLLQAREVGITGTADLFGGAVPHDFVKTKAIAHDVLDPWSEQPRGWSSTFAARVRPVGLPGYTVFSREDALIAFSRLLGLGPVRVKRPAAAGGHGQTVATTMADVRRVVTDLPDEELVGQGLVMETNLTGVQTLSVGYSTVGDLAIAYHGRQRLTTNADSRAVYGGSDLVCVRGDWKALERAAPSPAVRLAVSQARAFDEASAEYGVIVSRRNYDVAQGLDGRGQWRSGVLEQGWKFGGASGAEVLALEAFRDDPTLDVVHASSVEVFGTALEVPPGATVHFAGEDPNVGPMVRYSVIERHSPLAS